MKAVGVYVGVLRTEQGITQEAMAQRAGISEKTLRNLESGRHEPKLTKLADIVELLRGSTTHVAELMRPSATVERARILAREALSGAGFTDEQRAFLEGLTPEQKAALLSVARQMQ